MDKPKTKRLKRPTDPMRLAKLVGDIATGQIEDKIQSAKHKSVILNRPDSSEPTADEVRRVMSALGRIGGPKGGKARAESLTKKQRSEIAKKAALVRWTTK